MLLSATGLNGGAEMCSGTLARAGNSSLVTLYIYALLTRLELFFFGFRSQLQDLARVT